MWSRGCGLLRYSDVVLSDTRPLVCSGVAWLVDQGRVVGSGILCARAVYAVVTAGVGLLLESPVVSVVGVHLGCPVT